MIEITVAVPTFNRAQTIGRAIESALSQSYPHKSVLVIDDGSTDSTASMLHQHYRSITYIRQPENAGAGACRDLALRTSRSDWVLMLDSDDTLAPTALETVAGAICELPEPARYPVLFFCSSNALLPAPYLLLRAEDLLRNAVKGELVPVIQREVFLGHGYSYPQTRLGGEGLLWLQVARDHPIPAWRSVIVQIRSDAADRVTNKMNQVRRAREYAELQDMYISRFGALMRSAAPEALERRYLGSAIYWILAGDRQTARERLKCDASAQAPVLRLAVRILSVLPRAVAVRAFLAYRTLTA